jgi:hypothetical protein
MHITREDLDNRFNYHPPKDEGVANRHQLVRQTCLSAAEDILDATGEPSREQSLAITKLEEAMFWANAAIARDPKNVRE